MAMNFASGMKVERSMIADAFVKFRTAVREGRCTGNDGLRQRLERSEAVSNAMAGDSLHVVKTSVARLCLVV